MQYTPTNDFTFLTFKDFLAKPLARKKRQHMNLLSKGAVHRKKSEGGGLPASAKVHNSSALQCSAEEYGHVRCPCELQWIFTVIEHRFLKRSPDREISYCVFRKSLQNSVS